MDDVIFLSHYTSSGLKEILKYDIDFYFNCLDSALKLHNLDLEENRRPKEVILLGIAEK